MSIRTITLTDRPPVEIDEDHWPVVAGASQHDGKIEAQANRRGWVRVRAHADGRYLVYAGSSSIWEGEPNRRAGSLVPDGAANPGAVVEAIHAAAWAVGYPDLAAETIADLPAERI